MLIYKIITLLCTTINYYIIYKFLKVTLGKTISPRWALVCSFLGVIIINISNHFFLNIPIVTLFLAFLTNFILSLHFKGQFKTKFFLAGICTIFFAIVETGIVLLLAKIPLEIFTGNNFTQIYGNEEYVGIVTQVFITFFSFLTMEIVERIWKNKRSAYDIPLSYWLSSIVIPICTFAIMLYLLHITPAGEIWTAISCILFLLINIVAFFLYGQIIDSFSNQIKLEKAEQQNIYYKNLLENIRSANKAADKLQHDWGKHLIALKSLLDDNSSDQLKDYIADLTAEIEAARPVFYSNNHVIDGIVNYKTRQAQLEGITLKSFATLSPTLPIDDMTTSIVLGNLLDNAIEAVAKIDNIEERIVHLRLEENTGCLIITVSNPFEGKINFKDGVPQTTKEDITIHGIGMKSVNEAIESNGGTSMVETEDQIFTITVALLLRERE